jgi:hypothetical protein
MLGRRFLPIALAVGGLIWVASDAPTRAGEADKNDYIKVEIRGTIKTGIMAIGGETTGTIISTKDLTVELEVKDKKLREEAEKLDGKTAIVKGTLTFRKGVERGQRMIVVVNDLKAPK